MVVGLDVHKKETVAFVVHGLPLESGEWFSFQTTRESILDALPRLRGERVLIEASTSGKAVARFLCNNKVDAVLVPADVLSAHMRRAKSDKLDARDLARIGLVGGYSTCYIPTSQEDDVRAIVRHVRDLREQQAAFKNQIRAIAQRNLVPPPMGSLSNQGPKRRWRHLPLPHSEQLTICSKIDLLEQVEHQEEAVMLELYRLVHADPNIRSLLGIKGIDVYTAATVTSHCGDMTRFPNPKKIASYSGLAPRLSQSGTKARHGGITKAGPNMLRHALIEATHTIVRYPGRLQTKFKRLRARIGAGRAIVATARTLITAIWRMLIDKKPYADIEDKLAAAKRWRLSAVVKLIERGAIEDAVAISRRTDVRMIQRAWQKRITDAG
ncbi:MAG: IS110 family transposase [Candidatus Thermoplasmatota archaeon]